MDASYMEADGFYERVSEVGIVPVVVLDRVEDAIPMAKALETGGLPIVELTFRTAAAADCIAAIAGECPGVCVGAGTVLNVTQVRRARDAGASFAVSPGFDLGVVDWCLENGFDVIPAGVTPTEVTALVNRGLGVTKFFPASVYGGRAAIDALASVFVGHRFMPTGGVSPSNAIDYLRDEAVIACGGTWMCKPQLFVTGDFSCVEELAREAASLVHSARG